MTHLYMNESHSQSANGALISTLEHHNSHLSEIEGHLVNLEQSSGNPHIYSHTDVVFSKRCGDCHGTGRRWRKIGLLGLVLPKVPCDKCYRASGVCLKCKGHGLDQNGINIII